MGIAPPGWTAAPTLPPTAAPTAAPTPTHAPTSCSDHPSLTLITSGSCSDIGGSMPTIEQCRTYAVCDPDGGPTNQLRDLQNSNTYSFVPNACYAQDQLVFYHDNPSSTASCSD